MGNQQQLMNK